MNCKKSSLMAIQLQYCLLYLPLLSVWQVAPSNPLRTRDEVSALRCSILAASAYVALNLHDSVVALRHAKTLLAQPKLSGAHKFLGRMYMSEALLNLDDISEAVRETKVVVVVVLVTNASSWPAISRARLFFLIFCFSSALDPICCVFRLIYDIICSSSSPSFFSPPHRCLSSLSLSTPFRSSGAAFES